MSTQNLTNLSSVAYEGLESLQSYGSQSAYLHDQDIPELDLFSPLKIRDLILPNRVAMSPMC
ncbi:hypothetical protein [Nostoc sp. NMS8]|uniref:hypothetical protein n=1 Tax=Nostoc sp. NMS8 TaxID=2815392 RepID=UPI0025F76FDB|nr:hypothetical protein [Nostoc sp. NMS8]